MTKIRFKRRASCGAARRLVCSLAAAAAVAVSAPAGADQGFAINDQPVVARGSQGAWAKAFIDPGAVVAHDGRLHMFYTAIPKWPHPLAVGYTVSDDGRTWRQGAGAPVLSGADLGSAEQSVMSTSAVVGDDGQWMLFFTIVDPTKNFLGAIGRATAPSPEGPWTVDAEPVLTQGRKGAWDGRFVGNASVVKTDDGYRMYYVGVGDFANGAFIEEHQNVGMATSPDGVTWTKHDDPLTLEYAYANSDPVFLFNDDSEAWDSWHIADTNVQKTARGWVMVYRGTHFDKPAALGVATSADGIAWRRSDANPFLTHQDLGKTIYFSSFVRFAGQDLVFVEAGSTSGSDVFLVNRAQIF